MLAELGEHIDSHENPADTRHDQMTLNYLQSLNYLFERGFLSHDKITSTDSHVLDGMEYGYEFFSEWLLDEGKYGKESVAQLNIITSYQVCFQLIPIRSHS